MKLEINHLVPYLPHKLRMRNETHKALIEKAGQTYHDSYLNSISREGHLFIGKSERYVHITTLHWKPVLRPLAELNFEHYYFDFEREAGFVFKRKNETYCRMKDLDYLFENHYDVFGLIPAGLAAQFS